MFIKPRPYEPTSHTQSKMGYLPRWVWWPFKFARFSYDFVLEVSHANVPGAARLLMPILLYGAYKSLSGSLETKNVLTLGIVAFIGIIGALLHMKEREETNLYEWRVVKWEDDLSHYHTEGD